MKLIDFFNYEDKDSILKQLEDMQNEWAAIPQLISLIKENKFHSTLGSGTMWILVDEEKLTESTRQFESARSVIDGVKANNEELKARRIREKLGNVPEAISMSYVAKNYFGKTKTWLYQRLNGNKVNGKEACFTESEARQLQDALHDLGHRLSSIILI